VVDIETGDLLKEFVFSDGFDIGNLSDLQDFYDKIANGDTGGWEGNFSGGGYTGGNGWAWGNPNLPANGWRCRERRDNVQEPLVVPTEMFETCVITEDASTYEKKCCWKNGGGASVANCNGAGNCMYEYIKDKTGPGGVSLKIKGLGCQAMGMKGDGIALQMAEDYKPMSVAATPVAYNTTLGEFITRVFVPTTTGVIYRVDLANGEYDNRPRPPAAEGSLVGPYSVGAGADMVTYNWKATKWWDDPANSRPIMVKPSLAMSYERDLVVFYGTGVNDSLAWTDTKDYLYAVKEVRDPTTHKIKDTGEYFESETESKLEFSTAERLFGKPLVVAGKVYYTTYTPNSDECEPGDGALYKTPFDKYTSNASLSESSDLEKKPPPLPPKMISTPTGPAVVAGAGTEMHKISTGTDLEPASHVLHWGKIL